MRTQYATTAAVSLLMLTQIMGVVIFSGKAFAAGPPTVVTQAVSNIAQTSVILNGTTSPDGITDRGFQLGKTTGYGLGEIVDNSFLSLTQLSSFTLRDENNTVVPNTYSHTVAPNGDNYFLTMNTDGVTDQVYRVAADGTFIASWGVNGNADEQIRVPRAIAFDSTGKVYITDNNWHLNQPTVKVFSPDGMYITKWGVWGTGDGQFSSLGHIAIDGDDNVYIDDGNVLTNPDIRRVQKFELDGTYIGGWGIDAPDDVSGITNIELDSSNNVYVITSSPSFTTKVEKFDSDGDLLATIGSNGTGDGQYQQALDVIATPSEVYVLDNSGSIEKFDSSGNSLATLFISSNNGQFRDIALDSNGKIRAYSSTLAYVLEPTTAVVSVSVNELECGTTYHYRAYATNPDGTTYGDDETFTTSSCASNPADVTTHPATVQSARDFALRGTIESTTGISQRGFEYRLQGSGSWQQLGDDAPHGYSIGDAFDGRVTGEEDGYYTSILLDSEGNSYVLDTENDDIHKYNSSHDYVMSWNVESNVTDIAVDPDNNILVLHDRNFGDVGEIVKKYSSSGAYISGWGGVGFSDGQMFDPCAIVTDATGFVYTSQCGVGNNAKIQKFTSSGVFVDAFGHQGSGIEQMNQPKVQAVASNGDVYVLDQNYVYNNPSYDGQADRIVRFNAAGTYMEQWSDFGLSNNSYPTNPVTLTLDGNSDIYVVFEGALQNLNLKKYDSGFELLSESYGSGRDLAVNNTLMTLYATGESDHDTESSTYQDGVNVYAPSIDAVVTAACGSTYEYRAYAFNDAGISYGQILTFGSYACPEITTTNLTDGAVGQAYSQPVEVQTAFGGPASFTITDGELPDGLNIDSDTGVISGTPALGSGGTYYIEVTAEDEIGSDSQSLELYISQGIALYGSLNQGVVGYQYQSQLGTEGGFGQKVFEVLSGTLPPGITMDSTGIFSGVPTTAGTYVFTVEVTDLSGSDSAEVSLLINPPFPEPNNTPLVTITSPVNNTVFDWQNDTVVIQGTGPANQTIRTYMDGQELGTTTTNSAGYWTYIVNNVFPGEHDFDAQWIASHDVAFVANLNQQTFRSDILMIDTSTQEVLKTIELPPGAMVIYSSPTINHSGTKLYITAVNNIPTNLLATRTALFEYDLAAGEFTGSLLLSPGPYQTSSLVISADDSFAYSARADTVSPNDAGPFAGYQRINLDTFTLEGSEIILNNEDSDLIAGVSVAGGAMALRGTSIYTAASITDSTDPLTVSVINTINSAVTSYQIDDQPLCELCVSRIYGTENRVYYIANNQLVVLNPATNTILNTIALPDVEENVDAIFALAATSNDQKAYISTYTINFDEQDPELMVFDTRLLSVDIASETVDDITPDGIAINDVIVSIAFANNDSQLYLIDTSGEVRSMNIATGEMVEVSNLFAGLGEVGFGVYQTGTYYIGSVAPASATVNFLVGLAPEEPEEPLLTEEPEETFVEPETPELSVEEESVGPIPGSPAPTKTSPIKAPQKPATPQNSLLALVGRIPEPFAIGFPWFLLALALILIGMQYYQVHAEAASTKRMQDGVAHQKQLVEEQNNFVALSTHYLHTPLTVMEGEISLMVKSGTITQEQATKLRATLTSLNAEAEAAISEGEQDV